MPAPFTRIWLCAFVGIGLAFIGRAKAAAPPALLGSPVTFPQISEKDCPAELISIPGRDGNEIAAIVRRPPGPGPFPAIILLHGGLVPRSAEGLRNDALFKPTHARFLAAGYITVTSTYRSRMKDPQARDALEDCIATVEYLKKMIAVDPKSVTCLGGSSGGSLALEVAGEADLCAVAACEPDGVLFAGIWTNQISARSKMHAAIMDDPRRFYTPELQAFARAKIARVRCPVFFVQGGVHPINKVISEILIPEMRAAGKSIQVALYPGQPHGFFFGDVGDPAASQKMFDDVDAYFRRYLPTQPVAVDSAMIRRTPLRSAAEHPHDPGGAKLRKGSL